MLAMLGRLFSEHTNAPHSLPCGDSSFIADLYKKHKTFLFQRAGLYTDNPCAKEDIVQDTVLRLIRREDRLRTMEPAALITYISLTVRSAALNYIRTEQRDGLNALPLPVDEEQEYFLYGGDLQFTLEEQMLLGYRDEEVRAAVARLSERDQVALMGKYFLELDNRELAELLDVTVGTLRTLLCRARGRALKELREGGILHES